MNRHIRVKSSYCSLEGMNCALCFALRRSVQRKQDTNANGKGRIGIGSTGQVTQIKSEVEFIRDFMSQYQYSFIS
jgi:hypothetical protein